MIFPCIKCGKYSGVPCCLECSGYEVHPSAREAPPEHYAGKVEPWDYIAAHGLDFWQGNVVRYVTRAGRKSDGEASALVDYRKARNYIDYLIKREEESE